jgi:hypothetical protein
LMMVRGVENENISSTMASITMMRWPGEWRPDEWCAAGWCVLDASCQFIAAVATPRRLRKHKDVANLTHLQ